MLEEEVLPQLVGGLGQVVLGLEDLREALGEGAVKVDVAEHVPRVLATDGGARDAALGTGRETPFLGGPLGVLGGVVGVPDVGLEGVGDEVVVRGADVGVGEAVAHAHERGVVVARGVLLVDDEVDTELVGKVEEVLLLVAKDDGDVVDAGRLELLDLALDENLPANPEQALGLLVRDGGKAARETGRHDDGVVDLVGGQCRAAGGGGCAIGEVAEVRKLLVRGVDAAEGEVCAGCGASLTGVGVLEEIA